MKDLYQPIHRCRRWELDGREVDQWADAIALLKTTRYGLSGNRCLLRVIGADLRG